jgi:hypothetical protein
VLEQKIGALDQAAPLVGWDLPAEFATLRRLIEARMAKRGKSEFVQVLRLLEVFRLEDVLAAVKEAIARGAVGFDAVNHLVPGNDGRGGIMSVSLLVVDDEPDVADLFRQRFRRETRQGTYVMHFAASGEEALDRLAEQIQPALAAVLSETSTCRAWTACSCSAKSSSVALICLS